MLDAHPGPGKFKNQKKPFMPQYPSALYHVGAGDKLARLLPNPLTFTIGAGATKRYNKLDALSFLASAPTAWPIRCLNWNCYLGHSAAELNELAENHEPR